MLSIESFQKAEIAKQIRNSESRKQKFTSRQKQKYEIWKTEIHFNFSHFYFPLFFGPHFSISGF
jgi:hypothetical protein